MLPGEASVSISEIHPEPVEHCASVSQGPVPDQGTAVHKCEDLMRERHRRASWDPDRRGVGTIYFERRRFGSFPMIGIRGTAWATATLANRAPMVSAA